MLFRVDARIVPLFADDKGYRSSGYDLHTFYIDCYPTDIVGKAMQVAATGRKDVRVNLTYGPLEPASMDNADWPDGRGCDDILVAGQTF